MKISPLTTPLLNALSFAVHILPRVVKDGIGRLIGLFWFDILRIRRKTAIDNVKRAYPGIDHAEAVKMARTSLIHMGYNIVELFSFPFLTKKEVLEQFEFEGLDKLDKAFEPGKGVFMISVHIANGDLATAALSHKGYAMNLISKVFESEWLNDFWFKGREHHGTHFIPPRRSSYEILKALKKNEMVVFVLDQYTAPPNGVVTEFFGIKTGTAHGLALLAERSGATVLPAYTYRKSFGDNVVTVGDPIPFESKENKEETLRHNTQNYCDAVEAMVRKKPEQWMWVHCRWKPAWTTDEKGEHHLLPEETTWPQQSQ